jgi:acyl-CoA synthetase (AMP-forming)/AMP-acid ligase II
MGPDAIMERLRGYGARPAMAWRDESLSYEWLCDASDQWLATLVDQGIAPGTTLALCGDYSPDMCALLLAAIRNRNIIVPLASATAANRERLIEIAEVRHAASLDADGACTFATYGRPTTHPFLVQLADAAVPGLVLFSSGSTGEPKASVLDFERLLTKFATPRRAYNTLVFLLLDHIGGINTLFHTLLNGGTFTTVDDRSPDAVCAAVERHRIELLPTTPTFLRMLLISEAARRYDISSLVMITYGTEPMPETTLKALRAELPDIRLKQTYGLSELGILPTRSAASDSLWLQLGKEGIEHRIVNDTLWLRTPAAMLGYLNAPSPFDGEGWFNTQDLVEVRGDQLRVLGRKSELINVGGEKVHPTEIENFLLEIENVGEATVAGKTNAITGSVVVARVTPVRPEDAETLKARIRRRCRERLEPYKIPALIEIVEGGHHGGRFKKVRAGMPAAADAVANSGPS